MCVSVNELCVGLLWDGVCLEEGGGGRLGATHREGVVLRGLFATEVHRK